MKIDRIEFERLFVFRFEYTNTSNEIAIFYCKILLCGRIVCNFANKNKTMETSKWNLDGEKMTTSTDAVRLHWENATFFSLEHNGQKYHGEVIANRMEEGLLTIKLNHRVFDMRKDGPLDELIATLGLDKPKVRKLKQLKAPMPGRVVGIVVTVGSEIAVGDPLLTLEAMKMENVLKAEGIGVVKSIAIEVNQVVDKGSLLIEFE